MIDEFNKELVSLNGKPIQVFDLNKTDLTQAVSDLIRNTVHSNKKRTLQMKSSSITKNISTNISYLSWSKNNMSLNRVDYYVPKFFDEYLEIKYKAIEFEKRKNCELWLAKLPFTSGSQRRVYTGKLLDEKPLILKELLFLDPEYSTITNYKELIEKNAVASILFNSFCKALNLNESIRFIDISLVYVAESGSFYSIEEYIPNAEFINEYEIRDIELNHILGNF